MKTANSPLKITIGFGIAILTAACVLLAAEPPGPPDSILPFHKYAPEDVAAKHIAAMRADGSLTNVVATLARDGTICAIRDHPWTQHFHTTPESRPNVVECRRCKVCGAHQDKIARWE